MRIGLYSGSTLYPLAGESGVSERTHSGAADFSLTPESAVQVAQFIRAAYAKPIDRGNLLNVVSFTTTRQFATPAEAQLWCLDYHADFPSSGVLYFDAIMPDGFLVRRTMADTVVDPPRRRVIGATALLDYAARGGLIAAPSGYPDLVVSGTLTSDGSTPFTFPTMRHAGFSDGKPAYTDNGLTTGFTRSIVWIAGISKWWALKPAPGSVVWQSSSDTATPNLATGWTPLSIATGTPTVSLA